MVDHASLQRRAEAEGRRCTVGALIRDGAGRVFVHRRGWGRRLFPGCWDIVGGHVEPGETLVEALRREVEEETGWAVVGDPLLVHVADWERRMEPPAAPRREFDFAVEVEGDLRRPRVEVPKHVDFRWLADNELELLDENRGLDDGLVRRLVALALRPGHPSRPSYPHAMLFLDRTVVAAVEELRAVWDPAMTRQIPAHVTVTYPEEIASVDQLVELVGEAADRVAPFRLGLGRLGHAGRPENGVFAAIDDVDGGWCTLRMDVGPAPTLDVAPHLTIVHPRTTNRGRAAWECLEGTAIDREVTVESAAITAFDGHSWLVQSSFALGG